MIHAWYPHRFYFIVSVLILCEQKKDSFVSFLIDVIKYLTKHLENRWLVYAFVVVCLLIIINIYIYYRLLVSIIHNRKDMVGEAGWV